MRRLLFAIFAISVLVPSLFAADAKEEPVGLILVAQGGKVLRANTETALAARSGDILFSGDSLQAVGSQASFLYCPNKASETLDPGGEVLLNTTALKIKTGKLDAPKPVGACFLPQVVRVSVASQQHYGVSMTRGLGKPDYTPLAFDKLPPAVQTAIAPMEQALKANPNDVQQLVEEAAIFDQNKLETNAYDAYTRIVKAWPDATWAKGRIFELSESLANEAAIKAAEISPEAKTFGLIVGISKYEKIPQDLWPQFADADAKTFSQHLASPRGGAVPSDQVIVLTNEDATTAAIRNGFDTILRQRAGKKDTIFILIAAHGIVDNRGAYIMTYDSDPQDLSTTAIPFSEIQSLVDDELSKVGRVVLFADVAKTASIGNLKTTGVGTAVEKLGEAQGDMLGLVSARPREVSDASMQYGGGHGAFAYSVVKGLEGLADRNDDRAVDAGEISTYVRENVPKITTNKEHPRDFGNLAGETKLSDLSKQGITLARYRSLYDSRNGGPLFLADANPQDAPISGQASQDVDAFKAAIRAGNLLPNQPNSPWLLLDKLRGELSPEQFFLQQNDLRIALENAAQQVLLGYLAGDQNPQPQSRFDAGSSYMEAALTLTPESLYLEGRDDFFKGRSLLFDKKFSNAANLLEQSVRIDPGEAYGYNALGIAYLEQADFVRSIPAFRDAAKRAPNWSYPLHNLALAYVEAGRYQEAIASYQAAMKITPQYSYLPYNLGLVYQRMNLRREAEAAYRKAAMLAPNTAQPLNALGTLKASEGKSAEAEKLYREALAKNPPQDTELATRHNLALLLSGLKGHQSEAIDLWRQNIAEQPDYIASRLSLGEFLGKTGDAAGAIEQYAYVVGMKPDYTAARKALGDLYLKANQPEMALVQLREAAKQETRNASLWEQIGDTEKSLNHPDAAKEAFATALKLQTESGTRKRIRAKMVF